MICKTLRKYCYLLLITCVSTFNVFCQKTITLQTDTLQLWATYYYIPIVHHDSMGIDLLSPNQAPTGYKLNTCDWCTSAREGTVCVVNGNDTCLLNFAGRSDSLQTSCSSCSKFANYKNTHKTGRVLWEKTNGFGKGVNDLDLIPYCSIAVDTSVIPIGSKIFVADLVGIRYQNHKGDSITHDGYFKAMDVGSLIKRNHIDVFIGLSQTNPFKLIGSSPDSVFQAIIHKPTGDE